MNLAPAVLLEIIKYDGLIVSPYMWRWTKPDDTNGPSSRGLQPVTPRTHAELSACVDAEGAFGARPPACIPITTTDLKTLSEIF
jgi:hypothetical protein